MDHLFFASGVGVLIGYVTFILVILIFMQRFCEPMRLPFIANKCCLSDFKAIGVGCYKLVLNHNKSVISFREADAQCQAISRYGNASRLADLDEFTISKPAFQNFINCIGIPTSRNGGKLFNVLSYEHTLCYD